MRSCHSILWLAVFTAGAAVHAQTCADATKPYATLDRQGVTYRGPIPSAEKELPNGAAVIGVILPLRGAQQAEGQALLAAAQLAIEEEQSRGPLRDGRRLQLSIRDESGPWGQASMEILKLFDQDHALAILTSANGTSAHLAEQIANKISIPILTLSSDPSTTEANVPWLFRVGPSDTDQARAFCRRIYTDRRVHNVLLIAQTDHDGRTGAAEFEKAAKGFGLAAPVRFDGTDSPQDLETLQELLRTTKPDSVVVWTNAPVAEALLPAIRSTAPAIPVFLCSKAAQLGAPGISTEPGEMFTVESSNPTGLSKFQQLYLARTGATPGWAANEMYQTVQVVAAALRTTGANRVLLRNYLANEGKPTATAMLPFDPAGNSLKEFAIVRLQSTSAAKP
jgi:ABC-type branched-subunit amino acid transport system substrate-binding protein